jgi:uncharacterized DUF497 family protein
LGIEFDPVKRWTTLDRRGLDMARADEIFDGSVITVLDQRMDYGEPRFISVGRLDGRIVVLVWTPRGADRRVISLRKANEREQAAYGPRLD